MIKRCTQETAKDYSRYGGRGITVCDRWLNFKNFYQDMGDRPEGKTLGRINNELGYSKENCRWESMSEQSNNKRGVVKIEYNGQIGTVTEHCKKYKKDRFLVYSRLKMGWPFEKALNEPIKIKIR